jgi:serine/threonine-protein kinase HipA
VKQLDVIYKPRNITVGKLVHHGHDLLFEYDQAFLDTALNLSPFKLAFRSGAQKSDARFRHYLHGLFDDSLPDGWGLLLMDKEFERRGIKQPVSPLDRLAYVGDTAMGALSYVPSTSYDVDDDTFDIQQIAEESIKFYEGEIDTVLPMAAKAGGSPGGARPKILVGIKGDQIISGESDLPPGYEHWIIKFAAKKDVPTSGKMEYAFYLMAEKAGLKMMESRLFDVDGTTFFGTKRFDRFGNERVHMHTAANLLDADFKAPSLSYSMLCKLTSILTKNHQDVLKMFRMMVFNVAIQNQDDHAKNFSFLMDAQGEWRLSPPYDLSRSILDANEHTTSVAGKGNGITRNDMNQVASDAGISKSEASEIINQVNDVVANSSHYAGKVGLKTLFSS